MCSKTSFVLLFLGLTITTILVHQSNGLEDDVTELFDTEDELDDDKVDALIEKLERNYSTKSSQMKRFFSGEHTDSDEQERNLARNQNIPIANEPNCKRWAIC